MSSIKGGGRAKISSDIEESIISLLLNLRDPKNPLLPKNSNQSIDPDNEELLHHDHSSFHDLSDHDRRKERKRFLKQLLKCHQQEQLTQKLNNMSIHEQQSGEVKQNLDTSHGSTVFRSDESKTTGKVRVEIVEATLRSDDKKKSKKSSKTESRKSVSKWREGGTRKPIVLPRATHVKELKKLCKAKLQMKVPKRVFIIDEDSKLEIDLISDLSGLDDGTVIYATASSKDDVIEERCTTKEITNDESEKESEEQNHKIDHLQQIKDVYRMHKVGYKKPTSYKNERLPKFGPFLDHLEPLTDDRAALPAAAFRKEILESLDDSRVLIICGTTGCGKSTQVPQYIYEAMKVIHQEQATNIIVTQPRRVAAISLAKRVSTERDSPQPGNPLSEVGYNVRLARATSNATKITYCTVGVLLRMLVNPSESYGDDEGDDMPVPLSTISHVIIDEVHERDLNTDFVLTLLKPLLIVNKRISIILMSATASASLFADYFSMSYIGIQPRILEIPGRTYPISTLWLEDCEKMIKKKMNGRDMETDLDVNQNSCVRMLPRSFAKIDYDFIKSIILRIGANQWNSDKDSQTSSNIKGNGSILVFLPGKGEIDAMASVLFNDAQLRNDAKCAIFKLHSSLSPSQQWRAFQPVTYGTLKVVLATNVAETSITIPDVSYVVDTGRAKEVRFNPETRIKDLVTVWISKASSRQRSGRAGRTGPGVSYKLYSETFSKKVMLDHASPEVMRLPLEDLILQVCLLQEQHGNKGVNPVDFLQNTPEAPPKESIDLACSHLIEIGAIQVQSKDCLRLTALGYHLAHLPMDAKVGKILITGCILQCIEPALTIAAILSTPKSFWLYHIPGVENSRDHVRKKQIDIIKDGFGGNSWPGGSVKGDLIAEIAAFNAWNSSSKVDRKRKIFAKSNGLDQNVLKDIQDLRSQFKEALKVSGLLSDHSNTHGEDALLTSCCLVAGLYPNISTLVRPSRERKIRGGRLITKDGSLCKASSSSFQKNRVRDASESGKDAYAVYHSKHRIIGAASSEPKAKQEPFLSNINFVSRFAILLFGGDIEVKKNYLIVDEWLKFKVDDMDKNSDKISEKCQINAILIKELRKEIDQVIVKQISKVKLCRQSDRIRFEKECENVIRVVRLLLAQE